MDIRLDDLSDPRIAAFLLGPVRDMRAVSAPGSKQALVLDGLRQPGIRFWSAWDAMALRSEPRVHDPQSVAVSPSGGPTFQRAWVASP